MSLKPKCFHVGFAGRLSPFINARRASMDDKIGWDKRIAPRKDVFGEALVIAPGIKARCIVRDLSATGAKLGVSRKVILPQQFEVLLLKTKSIRRVMLRWRDGDFAGVQFCRGEAALPLADEAKSKAKATESGIKSSWRGRQ
jgi:hypothetical protein